MKADQLVSRYPRLYHMASLGSWESIKSYGLLSTSALLDLFEVVGDEREQIEKARRPDIVTISHPGRGLAHIRDNKPITDGILQRCLEDMTPAEWYEALNARVFFWLSEKRLETLLCAGAYRAREHTVLTVDTARLVERHTAQITLSPINSGAAFSMAPAKRGRGTFRTISDYPYEDRRSKGSDAVVELAVLGGVPDIRDFVIDVSTRQCRA